LTPRLLNPTRIMRMNWRLASELREPRTAGAGRSTERAALPPLPGSPAQALDRGRPKAPTRRPPQMRRAMIDTVLAPCLQAQSSASAGLWRHRCKIDGVADPLLRVCAGPSQLTREPSHNKFARLPADPVSTVRHPAP